jgi:glucokinase
LRHGSGFAAWHVSSFTTGEIGRRRDTQKRRTHLSYKPVHSRCNGPSTNVFVGIDIGGTKTAIVVSPRPPEVIWRKEFATRPEDGPAHAIRSIVELTKQALRDLGCKVSSIGVSCGGPLDRINGVIQSPPNLSTWDNVSIKTILQSEFGVPCHLENDANAGAIAEHRYGAGAGCRHMAFLTLGTGIGAGLILNGHIYHGASGMAGEIGHVRLTEAGPEGFDKAGSVEGWASGGGMAHLARETVDAATRAGEYTSLVNSPRPLTARDVGLALEKGDAVAERIVRETGARLGEALAILIDVLNPERIVLGGLALRLGESLLQPARLRLRHEALAVSAAACDIVPAGLGEGIGDVAALCVALGLHNS